MTVGKLQPEKDSSMNRELIHSARSLSSGIFKRVAFWVPLCLLTPFALYDRYIKPNLPNGIRWNLGLGPWSFFAVIVLILAVSAFLSYHELRLRMASLEERLKPQIDLIFGTTHPFLEDFVLNRVTPGRMFRVGVKNIGGESVDRVIVELQEIQPNTDPPLSPPLPLRQMHDHSKHEKSYAEGFPLAPGQTGYVDVLFKPFDQDVASICHIVQGIPSRLSRGTYTLTIGAYAQENIPACRKRVRVSVPNEPGENLFSPE